VNPTSTKINSINENTSFKSFCDNLLLKINEDNVSDTKIDESILIQQNIDRVLASIRKRKDLLIETPSVHESAQVVESVHITEEIVNEDTNVNPINEQLVVGNDGIEKYVFYRDKEETFECNVSISGASNTSSMVRLIIDTTTLNIILYGKVQKDGKCHVSIPKMTMFNEGTRGQVRLEVIVDDTLFVPWESSCIIEGSKTVTVDISAKKEVNVNFNNGE
jgi:hypothetical protein